MQQEKFNKDCKKCIVKNELKAAQEREENVKKYCLSEREVAKKIANYNRYLILKKD